MEFVEGAAYVSLLSDEVLIFMRSGHGFWSQHGASYPVRNAPNDLVCIWKPGDKILPIPHDAERRVVDIDVSPGTQGAITFTPTTEPPVELEVDPHAPTAVVLERRDAAGNLVERHPKTRGWFYPTRYNEHPGRYEDELDRLWACTGGQGWRGEGTDYSVKYPVDRDGGQIAVRWVGELDD